MSSGDGSTSNAALHEGPSCLYSEPASLSDDGVISTTSKAHGYDVLGIVSFSNIKPGQMDKGRDRHSPCKNQHE